MSRIRVGMSGWTYAPWRGTFYPASLVQKRELEYASRQVNAIEINGTFYSLQKPQSFQHWYEQSPPGFVFAVKGGRYISHIRRLKEVEGAVANFFASGILRLKEKLGPILWQFPPNVMLKDDRFEKFLRLLPRTHEEAAEIARGHSEKMQGRAWTEAEVKGALRYAFEFRHPSFFNPDFLDLLRAHNVAVVIAHAGKRSPFFEDLTADFVYLRMHGQTPDFENGYPARELRRWAQRMELWAKGQEPADATKAVDRKAPRKARDVFAFFDNEAKTLAPHHAISVLKTLGLAPAGKSQRKAG